MNERMLELLVQSGLLINVSEYRVNELDPNIKKFAELIVRECLKEIKDMIVDENALLYPNNNQTTHCVNDRLLDTYDNIIEHFGVKE